MSELERYSIELTQVGEGLKSARWCKSDNGHWVEHDQAQALLDAKQSEINALKAHVERLRDVCGELAMALTDSQCGFVCETRLKANEALAQTPHQSLAEHDATTLIKMIDEIGHTNTVNPVKNRFIRTKDIEQYANKIKAGDLCG